MRAAQAAAERRVHWVPAVRGRSSGRRSAGRVWLSGIGIAAAAGCLFLVYLRGARAQLTDADAAANALQARDLVHGNLLLHGWTLSDVSFYPTELVEYAVIGAVRGFGSPMLGIASATTYLLIVGLSAALAGSGRSGTWRRWAVGVATLLLVAPAPGLGQFILLRTPNHTGTAVPLLLAWLLLDRRRLDPRWLALGVTVVLAWAAVADRLVVFVGCVPLIVVGISRVVRAWRARSPGWRSDAYLVLGGAVAALASLVVPHLIAAAGGFHQHDLAARRASWPEVGDHLRLSWTGLSALFGARFADLRGPWQVALGVLHLVGIIVLALVLLDVLRRLGTNRSRVDEVLAVGILINLLAFVGSGLANNATDVRQLAVVLPYGAVLAARGLSARLRPIGAGPPAALAGAAPRRRDARRAWVLVALIVCVGLTAASLVNTARRPPHAPAGAALGRWLATHDLHYGLGGYWNANTVTLATRGAVSVRAVVGAHRLSAYHWESRSDWYDPSKHDARFLVLEPDQPGFGTRAGSLRQFGPPTREYRVNGLDILVYNRNLLDKLAR